MNTSLGRPPACKSATSIRSCSSSEFRPGNIQVGGVSLDPRAAGAKRLKDRIAVVTGSGQGIGRATARRMAEEGAIVMVCDRNPRGAQRTRDELRECGATAEMHVADISQPESAKDLMAAVKERFGRIDI